jgi:hypothetical protein
MVPKHTARVRIIRQIKLRRIRFMVMMALHNTAGVENALGG